LWFTVAGFHEISLLLFISLLLGRLSRSSDFVFSWCCSVLQAAPVWKSFCFSRELFYVLQVPVPNCRPGMSLEPPDQKARGFMV
jgi:hypothetical protein